MLVLRKEKLYQSARNVTVSQWSTSFCHVGMPKRVKNVPEKYSTLANHILPVTNQWIPFIPFIYNVIVIAANCLHFWLFSLAHHNLNIST